MIKKIVKVLIAFVFVVTLLDTGIVANTKKAEACYPAYKCYLKSSLPKNYTLYYKNPDRRAGSYAGGIVIGGLGFLGGTPGAVAAFLGGAAFSYREIYYGNLSYKTYIKRSPLKNKKMRIKTVYYEYTNYRGKQTVRVRDEN
ncbi:hypothetical protein G3M81_18835 [Bacillus paralicheniformis]|uniref:hypothetical protein n=1 Tax=Bacillus paralicheniformis TaxID=1648923 RepID=UPI0013EF5324|nr:hypothetical protein [Bacillus paralicheniformis]QII50659.1 hypothetical protein G3M81_18835 [Bacillus paralicheniformis]